MPLCDVTGELWGGRGTFHRYTGLFRSNDLTNPLWNHVRFVVFDNVDPLLLHLRWKTRLRALECKGNKVCVIEHGICQNAVQLEASFQTIVHFCSLR